MTIPAAKCWTPLTIAADGVRTDRTTPPRIPARTGKVTNEAAVVTLLMPTSRFRSKISARARLNIVTASDKCSDFRGNGH